MFCVKRKKKSVSCETSTQIDSNLNFAADERQSTGSFPKIVTPALALVAVSSPFSDPTWQILVQGELV